MRIVLLIMIMITSIPMFAGCPEAVPTDNPGFCSSFKQVAACYCTSTGLPAAFCMDLKKIYQRMVLVYGSLGAACQNQRYTSVETCIDDWNCYLNGGANKNQKLCGSTGSACV